MDKQAIEYLRQQAREHLPLV